MPAKKNNDLKIKVAEHGVKIEDLEQRAEERRQADIQIFEKLESINNNISLFREDLAGWKGSMQTKMALGGTIGILAVSAAFTALFRYAF